MPIRIRDSEEHAKQVLARLRILAGVSLALMVSAYVYLQSPFLWGMPAPGRGVVPAPDAADPGPRILVLAPHPDDDVLAVGGTIARAAAAGDSVLVVFLTSGEANVGSKYLITWNPFHTAGDFRALGSRREKEAVRSLSILGVHPEQAIFLRYPDGGLTALATTHWAEAYRSPFSHMIAPSQKGAFTPGSVFCGQDLLNDLVKIVQTFRPTVVYLPHPCDAHPDHQAAALLGDAAVAQAEANDPDLVALEVRAYLVHATEPGWPSPRRLGLLLALDASPLRQEGGQWESVSLSPSTVKLKLRAVRSHLSQTWISGRFLASFVRSNELYQPVTRVAGPFLDPSEPAETPPPVEPSPETALVANPVVAT